MLKFIPVCSPVRGRKVKNGEILVRFVKTESGYVKNKVVIEKVYPELVDYNLEGVGKIQGRKNIVFSTLYRIGAYVPKENNYYHVEKDTWEKIFNKLESPVLDEEWNGTILEDDTVKAY